MNEKLSQTPPLSPEAVKAPGDWRAALPFPAHWLTYIAVKAVLLVLATAFALYWYGLF